MAVKYRIEYCNKSSDTARLDIDVRGYSGQVYPIEGTGDLFLLEYKRTDDYILSTVADIQIFSDENFNIDLLKTSDETELKALFYVNNILKWQGYILPDFFQTGIVGNKAVSMTATDRISVLKDVAMDYSLEKISYAQLIASCLEKTGLSMNFNVVADFMLDGMPNTFHIMNCYVDHTRVTNKNKYLSAWDVLRSILVLLNAQIVQWAGEWWIVNRYQLRNGGGRVFKYLPDGTYYSQGTFTPLQIPFTFIHSDGRRRIEPVASQASVFMEFGGAKRYPEDYEFRYYNNGYNGWTAVNGFTFTTSDKEVLRYSNYKSIEGTRVVRPRIKFENKQTGFGNQIPGTDTKYIYLTNSTQYLKSTPLVNTVEGKINVDVQINGIAQNVSKFTFIILIDNKRTDDSNERYYVYGKNGLEKLTSESVNTRIKRTCLNEISVSDGSLPWGVTSAAALNFSSNIKFSLNSVDVGVASFIGTEFSILIYGSANIYTEETLYVEEASISITAESQGNGILYRTNQGAGNYSNRLEADTTIFGDHLTQGINGYFYAYTRDELSIHSYLGSNIRTGWTSPDDTLVNPLILHSVRQRARINSIAKNILNVIFSEIFNPLAVYTCGGKSYVPRAGKHDFLRTRTEIELEENASQPLAKVDYVYTYFGDEKEKGITTLSGISGGGSSGGTASHTHNNKDIIDQLSQINLDVLSLLEIDENDNLKVNTNLYSTGEVSAYGIGSSGGGGGGSTVAWGAESAGSVPLTVEGISKTLSLASHTHSGYLTVESDPTVPSWVKAITTSDITNWNVYGSQVHSHTNKSILDATTASFLTADRNKLDGIAAGAEVNVQSDWNATSGDALILNKPTTLAGYGITDAVTLSTIQDITGLKRFAKTTRATDPGGQAIMSSGIGATSSAFGDYAGIGFHNPGINWANLIYDGSFRLLNSDFSAYQSIHALSFVKSGGTSTQFLMADGSVDTYGTTAGTVAEGNHTHSISDISTLQDALNSKLATSIFTAHDNNATKHITAAERTDWNSKLATSIFTAHAANQTTNVKHLTDAQLSSLIALASYWKLDNDGNLYTERNLYSTLSVSAYGLGSTGGGSGLIQTVYGYSGLGGTYNNATLTDTFNAYTINQINNRLQSVEGGSATSVSVTGTGDVIVGGSKAGNAITLTKGNQSWANLTGKPSTFAPSTHTHQFTEITGTATTAQIPDLPASKITSGVFATARLGTGTPSSSNYLRGDGTWASVTSANNGTLTLSTGTGLTGSATFTANQSTNSTFTVSANFGTTAGTVAEGNHTHTKSQVGLSNVDNTSDVNKPISIATQTALNGKSNIGHSHNLSEIGITGLTTNYLTKFNGSTFVNSSIFDNGTNVGIRTNIPTTTLDVNGTGKFKDDILMTFNEWSYNSWPYPTDKNSLNKFLKLFDIDTAGNLVVKTNLYSTGEVSAYKSGTGISGLTLMADMNANGKNITGANSIMAGDAVIGNDPLGFLDGASPGLYNAGNDGIIAAYNNTTGKFHYANGNLIVDYSGVATSPTMQANEFVFGNWKFKQDTSGRLGIFNNNVQKAYIDTAGNYVKI